MILIDPLKLLDYIEGQETKYKELHAEALSEFDARQGNEEYDDFQRHEARLEVCRWASRIITLGDLKRRVMKGELDIVGRSGPLNFIPSEGGEGVLSDEAWPPPPGTRLWKEGDKDADG